MKTLTEVNPLTLPRVGQYMGCWADKIRTFGDVKFRVVGYYAYNAFGLIGPEMNGIAILDENSKSVVTDMIACGASGSCGTPAQRIEFERIMTCSEEQFKAACLSGRTRLV